ncbi:MAG: glycosyltransferase family 2 protein [Planctomycetota bacterium]
MNVPDVSLVVPVRNESGNIGPLVAEIGRVLDAAGLGWELFVVDDGSTDDSWQEISRAADNDNRVQGIRQRKGLGKSAALTAGFQLCRAARIVMLDGDGQDDPAEIPKMLAMLATPETLGTSTSERLTAASGRDGGAGVDLVNGWKTPRLDPWHKTLPSRVFNVLVGWLTGLRLHDHNCGLKAFSSRVAREILLETDMHRFLPVLAAAKGFRVTEMPVHHRPRTHGHSKYGVARFFTSLPDLVRVAIHVRGRGQHAVTETVFPRATRARHSRAHLRWGVYGIVATLAIGSLLGRIGGVTSVDKIALENRLVSDRIAQAASSDLTTDATVIRKSIEREKRLLRPFLSGNDRSRWLTIRALVEHRTFAIDTLVVEPGWDTLDAVAHPDSSGRLRLYSSKPPLLSVLCAGPYWLLHRVTGWTLGDHPFEMGRLLMVLYGLVPLAITILFTCRLIDAIGTTDWGRIWAASLIACGTMLSTFAVVLTNHVPAASCTAASAWLLYRIRCDGLRSWWAFGLAGLCAGLAAAAELPALAWCVAVLALLATSDLRRTLLASCPAAMLVAASALGTNWLAHGSLFPPYAHRAVVIVPAETPTGTPASHSANWYDYSLTLSNGRVLTSYWRNPKGIDRGEPSLATYAWHTLAGHHGIVSLTPAWLLVIPGLCLLASMRRRHARAGEREIAMAIAIVSAVVILFYLSRPQLDRNYGGMTSGFRWVFWLAPLWAAAAVPAADRLSASRIGRGLALVLLGLSVVSVAYPTWNPWTQPWIERWLIHAGWLATP